MLFVDFEFLVTLIQIVVIFVGLLGNVISFVVFSRKTFSNNSISTYCRALAIFDSLVIFELIQNSGQVFSNFTFSIINLNDINCKIFFYMMALYSSIPAWILVVFSIDKMLSMRRNAILLLRKKSFQWSVVLAISLINLFLYIEVPIKLVRQVLPFYFDYYYCDISSLDFFTGFIIGYLFQTAIIPFAVMFVTSIVTIRLLAKSRNALTRGQKADAQRKKRDTKFAISSLAFNFIFVALKMPLVIVYTQVAFNINIDLYFYQMSLFLFFLNASSNFYIHFATNSIFRRELFIIMRITKDSDVTTANSNNISNRIKPTFNNSSTIPNISQNI